MTDAAFREAYRLHKDVLYRFAHRMSGSGAAAEDIVQDAYLALWRNSAVFDPARGALRAFLLGVARNVALQTVRLRFEPLTVLGVQAGWTLLGPSKYPVISPVRIGDTVALDLLVNPATGQRIVEYLTLRRVVFDRLLDAGAPRDFSIADVNLTVENPRVWTDGKFEEATADNSASLAAHILWFFLPEGAFEISLWPEPALGFHKAGVIGAKTLTFHDGGSEYRVESSSRIVPGEGLYNVYVLRDPDWGPGPGKAGFALGCADKPKQLSLTKPQ
jgi:hypothetical protein